MDYLTPINERIKEAIALKQHMLDDHLLLTKIQQVVAMLVKAYRSGNKTIFCGNGGSAADAQHLAAELSGKFYLDRPPIQAEACHVNTSFLTAVSNDYSFAKAYARYVEAVGKSGDVLVAISTSGNSENIVQAIIQAKEKGLAIVVLSGATGGIMADYTDVLINVPSNNTPRIQEAHILIGHIICEMVESELFGSLMQHPSL